MTFDPLAMICGSHGPMAASTFAAGLYGALFLAGLTGSLAHCAPMCGPLVIAQASARLEQVPVAKLCEMSRLRSGLLLPYHLGRLTSYAALGAVVALFGEGFSQWPWCRGIAAGLLIAAAVLLLRQGFGDKALLSVPRRGGTAARMWAKLIAPVAGDLRVLSFPRTFVLGLLLGFLPCGLLYAALATAAASANPWLGASGMLAFGLGTVPLLAVIGIIGQAATLRLRRWAALLKPFVLTWNAGLLLLLAAAWIIEV